MRYKRKTFFEDYIKELTGTELDTRILSISSDERNLYKDSILECKSQDEFYEYIDIKCLELREKFDTYEVDMHKAINDDLKTVATTIRDSVPYFIEFLKLTGALAKTITPEDMNNLCINIFNKLKKEHDEALEKVINTQKEKFTERISNLFVIAHVYYNEVIKMLPEETINEHKDIKTDTEESIDETSSR